MHALCGSRRRLSFGIFASGYRYRETVGHDQICVTPMYVCMYVCVYVECVESVYCDTCSLGWRFPSEHREGAKANHAASPPSLKQAPSSQSPSDSESAMQGMKTSTGPAASCEGVVAHARTTWQSRDIRATHKAPVYDTSAQARF
jgi:hypothetical protein